VASIFQVPLLNRRRISLAFLVALAADGIQLALGPFGWTFLDEFIDVLALISTSLLIGFHPLLLPTFIVELLPIVDMLPTWTGCVGAVVLLRKRQQQSPPPTPPRRDAESKVIDV